MASLARRLKGEASIEMDDLEKLKTVYMIHIDKTDILSKLSEEHMEIAARLGISLEI